MDRKIVCIIQARTGSTRLPSKVSLPILGKPMLAHQIERDKTSKRVNTFVVATTDKKEDDVVKEIAERAGIETYRGSELDVLDRYYQAAKEHQADVVVRVTGDCPLHYGAVIDETIQHFEERDFDYARSPSNYPEGLDTEVFTFAALEKAWKEAMLPSEREHVTPYLYTHPELFTCDTEWTPASGGYEGMHWSVDTEGDFAFATHVYEALYTTTPFFTKEDVFEIVAKHPEWLELLGDRTGYEGYSKSLEEDKNNTGA